MSRKPVEPAAHARYRQLGAKLRALRQAARLNQPELAGLIHVSQSYPGTWERGRYRPKPETLRLVCAVLLAHGADPDYDELAQLAGYAGYTPPPVDVVPVDDPRKAPLLRRLARLSPDALAKLEAVAQAIELEVYSLPPDQPKGPVAAERRA